MKAAVVVFPGSNCDHDTYHAFKHILGVQALFVWHKETSLEGVDAVILPGGFSYGDYLRCGAIARFSPIMQEVEAFAKRGGPVLGICNGFQTLIEAGLLPGALLRNRSLSFICRDVYLRAEAIDTVFTSRLRPGHVLKLPIAHHDGNYYADAETLKRLNGEGRVIFRYVDPDGRLDEKWNFNGSSEAIAGVVNERRNVFGLMPHPERAVEATVGGRDGRLILGSLVDHFLRKVA
jgi:phosphoribosylformylglycinamidine synthase I